MIHISFSIVEHLQRATVQLCQLYPSTMLITIYFVCQDKSFRVNFHVFSPPSHRSRHSKIFHFEKRTCYWIVNFDSIFLEYQVPPFPQIQEKYEISSHPLKTSYTSSSTKFYRQQLRTSFQNIFYYTLFLKFYNLFLPNINTFHV